MSCGAIIRIEMREFMQHCCGGLNWNFERIKLLRGVDFIADWFRVLHPQC